MKIGEAESWLKNELRTVYEEQEAANISSMVMEHVTGCDLTQRLLKKEEPLVVSQLHHLTEIHHRLLQHEPVQYAIGEAWFYGMKLTIDQNVLIPRPETEELVDWVVMDVKSSWSDVFSGQTGKSDKSTELRILDVGTGSGCIALALKKAMPGAEVWGCDISDDALNLARRNGSELDIRIDFLAVDFLDAAQRTQLPMYNIIVSNPPYIPQGQRASMHKNVLYHEPHAALFVPDEDPLVFYRALAEFGASGLEKQGSIYMEINEEFGERVLQLLQENGYNCELRKDLQGKDRMIRASIG